MRETAQSVWNNCLKFIKDNEFIYHMLVNNDVTNPAPHNLVKALEWKPEIGPENELFSNLVPDEAFIAASNYTEKTDSLCISTIPQKNPPPSEETPPCFGAAGNKGGFFCGRRRRPAVFYQRNPAAEGGR